MSDSKKKVRRATNPVVETLESRQLMSVTVIDMGGSGDYLVQGTTGDDSFTVSVNQVTQAFTVAGNTIPAPA